MSGLFDLGLEEDQKQEDIDTNIGVEDLLDAAETMEIEELAHTAENMQNAMEKGMESANLLESMVEMQTAALESENLNEDVVKAVRLAHEGLAISLGVEADVLLPGCESDDPKEQLQAGLEADKNILQKIWDTIKKVFAKVVDFFSKLITKIMMKVKNVDKMRAALVSKAKDLVKTGFEQKEDWKEEALDGVAGKLLAATQLANAQNLNQSTFTKINSALESAVAKNTDVDFVKQSTKTAVKAMMDVAAGDVEAMIKVTAAHEPAVESCGYGSTIYRYTAKKDPIRNVISSKALDALSIDGDKEITVKFEEEMETIKDAKDKVSKMKKAALDPKYIASDPMKSITTEFEKAGKADGDLAKATSEASKEIEGVVKKFAKDTADEQDGFMTKMAVRRAIIKLLTNNHSSIVRMHQRAAMTTFKNILAMLAWQEKSLAAYKAK